ncbi:5'-3' exoribonuclease 1-like isoform X2 [Copidosoma floridanum]|uniref:5'-3' exoribonuclease 1-like isoform X2 n=1 Tax=Copidosoma floridanum TaxID=29053 RepID=UPI0006C9D23A|nr:5'-3' exoribonuclease 1-like isoform X2 [Copidosoma floridanum]
MGVPKFFRYISERYPCLSEKLKENQIPEFDNLYLDMNGIIHNCSHPNDADVSFRITEETIFKNIFHYIEILFRIIQPQKLFFMAVDGVAPRAKINQQRGRRFRAAKDAEIQEAKARAKGQEIPKEARFDSNCITPGTVFMSKLSEQLKFFITQKISTDKIWQKCKIILSGSEVPGEGEHKIMDYIRYMKAQPDYKGNTRHCLYGLDADLIMLGLCSHEPQFSLLREEVKFGKAQKKILTPEETNFCLLHLSLMREYLEHEFSPVKDKLPFKFDLEKIIDDWVLMGFLVGNDFIPHLPNLHIENNALPILYNAYMDVLPTLNGYINEAGTLNLERFEKFMEKLGGYDMEQFDEIYADLKYLESKTGRHLNDSRKSSSDENSTPKKANKALDALIMATKTELGDSEDDDDEEEESDDELNMKLEFVQHKRDYYMNKMEYANVDAEIMRSQAEGYIRAIQWNLHYYYNGCCSWSWYYPHHYAPYISDIKNFKDLKLEFDMGEPFKPFEQLLAVLPAASKSLLPKAYHGLMTEENSPIIKYYPLDFKTDLNGKKQEWEAVVLIPLIDETSLLNAMMPCNVKLTFEEQKRNQHGPMAIFSYTDKDMGIKEAPEYFGSVRSRAFVQLVDREEILVVKEKLVKGLCKGVRLSTYFPGFPTLQHIPHTASFQVAKVKVFEQPSRRENMILKVLPRTTPPLEDLANNWIGKTVYVCWPHLVEAVVVGISDAKTKISVTNAHLKKYTGENLWFNTEKMDDKHITVWNMQKKSIIENYKTRLGVEVGDIEIIVHACTLTGCQYVYGQQGKMTLEKQWNENSIGFAYQVIVDEISVHDSEFILHKCITDVFKVKDICFMLGHPHYGSCGEVTEPAVDLKTGRIKVSMRIQLEPNFDRIRHLQADTRMRYMPGNVAAQRLGISSHLLSRITGTIFVIDGDAVNPSNASKYNVGLNLKFNKKNEEVQGFTRKDQNGVWLYSVKAVDFVKNYMQEFPELFERLETNLGSADMFLKDNLFPNNSKNTLETIVAWVKEKQKVLGTKVRACGIEELELEVVQEIEKEIDECLNGVKQLNKNLTMHIKPYLLYKPGLNSGSTPPDPKAHHRLLDRIVCVRDSFTVPLGYRGTIVGIQKNDNSQLNMYEVLFDQPFEGGLVIHNCSPNRGYRLSPTDFINISYGLQIENKSKIAIAQPQWRQQQQQQPMLPVSNFSSQFKLPKQPPFQAPDPSILSNVHPNFSKNTPINKQLLGRPLPPKNDFNDPKKKNSGFPAPPTILQKFSQPPEVNKNVQQQRNAPQQGASEFQALWNELQQIQKPLESPKKQPQKVKEQPNNKLPSTNKEMPQDPSAFLKAMLKISDNSMSQSLSKTSTTPSASSVSSTSAPVTSSKPLAFPTPPQTQPPKAVIDTPPLVQQMFDHARKAEIRSGKSIWYCSRLLSYYQLLGTSFPRYNYCTNKDNLVCAQITLPDMRIFCSDFCNTHGEAAENAAKKVYEKLQQEKPLPLRMPPGPMRAAPQIPPQHPPPQSQWYGNRPGVPIRQPMPPANMVKPMLPAAFPQASIMPMSMPMPPLPPVPKWNQQAQAYGPIQPPPMHKHQQPPHQQQRVQSQNQQYQQKFPQPPIINSNVDKLGAMRQQTSPKKSTPFVPLQAQKKTRNVINKQPQQQQQHQHQKPFNRDQSERNTMESKIEQKTKENLPSKDKKIDKKEDKKINNNYTAGAPAAQKNEPQNTKQRRSRVAARFQAPLANGSDKQ